MQAEHIPVHLGSMPDAVAAVLGRGAAPGRELDPQRPLPRRHPPARHHPDLAGLRRRRARRLRRLPRPPRRRRRPDAGQHAGRLEDARRRGGRDPADPRPTGTAAGDRRRRCASPSSASPTCAPSGPPTGSAPCASPSSPSATGSSCCGRGWRRSSPTPSAAPGRRCAELPDGAYAAEDVLEDDAGGAPRDVALRVEATIAGDRLTLDFTGTDPQVERQPQLPALGDEVGRLLRGARR